MLGHSFAYVAHFVIFYERNLDSNPRAALTARLATNLATHLCSHPPNTDTTGFCAHSVQKFCHLKQVILRGWQCVDPEWFCPDPDSTLKPGQLIIGKCPYGTYADFLTEDKFSQNYTDFRVKKVRSGSVSDLAKKFLIRPDPAKSRIRILNNEG